MRAFPVLVALLATAASPPTTGPVQARPATTRALSFLVGAWGIDTTTFAATHGDAASRSTGRTDCVLEGHELRCRTRIEPSGGRSHDVEVSIVAVEGHYRAHMREPEGESSYRGSWKRPDTLVFTTEAGDGQQRIFYRDAAPDRVWVYVDGSDPEGAGSRPRSETVWTRLEGTWTPAGRRDDGRAVRIDAIVPGAPDAVAALFLNPEALNRFMGDSAHVGSAIGDPFEVSFLPESHPGSAANSTAGAEILDHDPGRRLVVEWTAPPWLAALDRDPLPTWAEISFHRWDGAAGATHVRVVHRGFRDGEDWDRLRSFLHAGWSSILFRLQALLWSPDRPSG